MWKFVIPIDYTIAGRLPEQDIWEVYLWDVYMAMYVYSTYIIKTNHRKEINGKSHVVLPIYLSVDYLQLHICESSEIKCRFQFVTIWLFFFLIKICSTAFSSLHQLYFFQCVPQAKSDTSAGVNKTIKACMQVNLYRTR